MFQISHVILQTTSQFFLKILHHSLVSLKITPLYFFLAQTFLTLVKRRPLKCKFLRLSSGRVKICQIPNVNFETTIQIVFKFFIILQCHYT